MFGIEDAKNKSFSDDLNHAIYTMPGQIPVGLALFDLDYRLIFCNPTWVQCINLCTSSEHRQIPAGVSFFNLLPGLEGQLIPYFVRVMQGETFTLSGYKPETCEAVYYWDLLLTPFISQGEIRGILNTVLDATQRILNEQQLESTLHKIHESEGILRSIMENAQSFGVYRIAIDPSVPFGARVLLVSHSFGKILGIDDPLNFQKWFINLHPDDVERVQAANQRSVERGVPYNQNARFYNSVEQKWVWVHTVSTPYHDESGEITHFDGFVIDLTEQKMAEMELQEAKSTLEIRVLERTQEIERRRMVASSLREILSILNSNKSLEEILHHIVVEANRLVGSSACVLHQIEYESAFVAIQASCGLPDELASIDGFPLDLDTRSDANIMARKPIWIKDFAALRKPGQAEIDILDHRVRTWREVTGRIYAAWLAVPMIIRDEVYGSLAFYFLEPNEFNDDEITLAQDLVNQMALALENARLRMQAEENAISAERNRLARELHDAVTQTLFSTSMIADVLPRLWEQNPEVGRQRLEELRQLTRGALAEMRTLLLELRPTSLVEASFEELMRYLTNSFTSKARIPVQVQLEGSCDIPPDIKVTFYRIAQEAMNNVMKHSGAQEVILTMKCTDEQIVLTIEDDGCGFELSEIALGHLGLGIMRERAEQSNLGFRIMSQPGCGTIISVTWLGKAPPTELITTGD